MIKHKEKLDLIKEARGITSKMIEEITSQNQEQQAKSLFKLSRVAISTLATLGYNLSNQNDFSFKRYLEIVVEAIDTEHELYDSSPDMMVGND